MSDHHVFENSNSAVQNTAENPVQSTYGTVPGYRNSYQQPAAAYSWSSAPVPQKKKNRWGVKLLAVVLCCLITSGATLGVFVLLLQNGVVSIPQNDPDPAPSQMSGVLQTPDVPDESAAQEAPPVGTPLENQDIAAKLIPSVVCIQNYQVEERFGFQQTGLGDTDVSPAGEGSGIIYSQDGYIITNAHVVANATSLKVVFSDGMVQEAQLVGSDTQTDLAVIKVEAENLPAADFGASGELRVADQVMAIGNPGGSAFNSSVTIGYVSALHRTISDSKTGYTTEYIQTDAAINPGNSGGALVNRYGQVIGINSAKISATGYEGLGFAIPTDDALPIVSDLIEYGYVKDRAMLGIAGQFIDSLTGRFYGLPQGEYVGQLLTDAAASSGLQEGDVIVAIDDTELTSAAVLRAYIHNKKPGDVVTLTVYRPSTDRTGKIQLTLSEYTGQ